jgi:hypothetical protein
MTAGQHVVVNTDHWIDQIDDQFAYQPPAEPTSGAGVQRRYLFRYHLHVDSEAELLHQARQAAGLSQRDLAERAGTTQAMVARYESGAASPTVATLRRLLGACDLRLDLRTAPLGAALQGPVGQRVAAHRKEIRRLVRQTGARNVRVFGSTARGEDHEDSDLDLLVDFPVRVRGLIPLADLADRIAELLELPVDVAAEEALAPDVAAHALREAVAL